MNLRWTLRLYPRAWQSRYRDEMEAVLEQRPATVATLVDLLRGALEAHLDPSHVTAGMPAGAIWTRQLQLSTRTVFWSFPLFLLIWGLLRLLDAEGPWSPALGVAIMGSTASFVSGAASIGSMVATLLAGVLISVLQLRRGGSLGNLLGRALPPVLPPLVVATVFILHGTFLRGQSWWVIPPYMVFWPGALILPLVIGRAVVRDELPDRGIRLAFLAGAIVAVSLVAHVAVLIAIPVAAGSAVPADFWTVGRMAGVAALMLPALLALRALGTGAAELGRRRAA